MLEYIKNIRKSEDNKTLLQNFAYLSICQVVSYVFPLITIPYLARVIGPDGFGKFAFAAAVVVWVQTIADWGFIYTATRDVAQNRNNKDTVSRIFSNVMWAQFLLTILSGIILFIVVLFVPYFRKNADVIFITFLMVPGHILFPAWFFQAVERMKFTTIFNLTIKLLFTVAVFLVIKEPDDYVLNPLLTSIGYVVCGICSQYIILKKWGYRLYKPDWKGTLNAIKNSSDIFIYNLMPNLYNSFSVMLLGVWGDARANGIYDGGNKIPSIFYNLQNVLSRTFYPFLSRRYDKHRIYAIINISVSIIGAIILLFISPFIINIILGPEFIDSVIIMQIMSISIIFLAINDIYGTNYLILRHHERELRNITTITSIIGMLVAVPSVYYFHAVGAAVTVCFSRVLLGFLSFIEYIKLKRNNQ